MSEPEKTGEWDSMWEEYVKSLENWKALCDQIQAATSDMQSRFNDVWEKAFRESSADTIKSFGENWQNAMNEAGMKPIKEFGDSWQRALNSSNTDVFKQFVENWQNSTTMSGFEQMTAYGEMMKKFADTWNSMWPKS